MRCGASFCYRGNAEGVFEVTLTKIILDFFTNKSYNHNVILQMVSYGLKIFEEAAFLRRKAHEHETV